MGHGKRDNEFSGEWALYALGLLDEHSARKLENHLADGCAACRRELADTREILSLIPLRELLQTPRPELKERLRARVRAEAKGATDVSDRVTALNFATLTWEVSEYTGISWRHLRHDAAPAR